MPDRLELEDSGDRLAPVLLPYLTGPLELPRFVMLWSAVAWVGATVGMGALVSDAVHDLSQASLGADGLEPPVDAIVGEVGFLSAAAISVALLVACRRLRHARSGTIWQRRLHSRQLVYGWLAVVCVVLAGVTAAID